MADCDVQVPRRFRADLERATVGRSDPELAVFGCRAGATAAGA